MASAFDLFKLGVGPSSSHTMGPMTAGARFLRRLGDQERLAKVTRVEAVLYASLALTGRGHATDRAVILGLAGFVPASIDPDAADAALETIRATGRLNLGDEGPEIAFDEARGGGRVEVAWDELQRADAVAADHRQKAEGIDAVGADPFGHPAAQGVDVRQKIVEHGNNGGAAIGVFPQRQGQRHG